MTSLRVLIASPDDALRARVAAVVSTRDHRIVLESALPFEALEACLDGNVDVAILDDALRTTRGSEVAAVLADIRPEVWTIVLQRGELGGDQVFRSLNPYREGSEAAPADLRDGAGGPSGHRSL